MKRFVALARVSSREQEREGFSLDIQEDALKHFAELHGGQIIKFFRIAETASKREERKTFRELVAYAKKHSMQLDGLLVYKVDRAARNLYDFVEIERLESEFGVPFICVSQPTENNPAGRMMRRTLANMASFYTEQQSVDVREGIARRVKEGLFPGKAPYGYRNVRRQGRSIVEVDRDAAPKVKRLFQLFAYENHTIDSVCDQLEREHLSYRPEAPKFPRSKVHSMLHDRAYIGEIMHKGQWHPGTHEPLVDRNTWNRVQTLLGGKIYHSYQLTYAGQLIRCAHCGHFITGEQVRKKTKSGENWHVYYRCSRYRTKDHPQVRLRESQLDEQILQLFASIKIDDPEMKDWFAMMIRSQTRDSQEQAKERRDELQRQLSNVMEQQDRLLNLRVLDEISAEEFQKKKTQLRDREAELKLGIEALDRSHHETADLTAKVFELSQSLTGKWLASDYAEKRKILEIVCLNPELDDVNLCVQMRKPFDVLAKGLSVSLRQGDKI